jgi:hypothetical protein
MKKGPSRCASISRMASVATRPSVCSSSFPSAASQLKAALILRCGSALKTSASSVLSRPEGFTVSCHEAASSWPAVPMPAGTS